MPASNVYSSPTKRSRRLDIRVHEKTDKYISRRPYAPGQHGNGRRVKLSDYALQLREKQRAKFIYSVRERQFRKTFAEAQKATQATGERLLQLLELRLDNVVYRSGLAKTRRHARQIVNHGHIQVNKKRVSIPSYTLSKGDIVSPVKTDGYTIHPQERPTWISFDEKKKQATINKIPLRSDMPLELNEQMIVEFYSR